VLFVGLFWHWSSVVPMPSAVK
jgi:hypothetical protein